MGRPSEFSTEIMAEICERMSDGKSLREICEADPDMPARRTILRWVKNDDAAKKLYDQAQQERMHWYADEIIKIAYDTSKDTIKGGAGQDLCNHEWIARSRLKVDSLKFLMAKLAPRSYGDKPLPEPEDDRNLKVSWEAPTKIIRVITGVVRGDDGSVIDASDNEKLRARIAELEERLGIGEPPAPKLLTYDPGPLPSRFSNELRARFARIIGDNMPDADRRSPEDVLDEALSEFESALKAKYQREAAT